MRILPVSKVYQILRSCRSRGRGQETGGNYGAGMLKRFFSTQYRKGLPDGQASSVVSDIHAGVSQTGAWRVSTVPRWRFMGTVAGAAAPRFTGAGPVQIVRREGYASLFQIWKAWRLKEFDSHFQGMRDFSYRKFHDGIYWRPAVFVSLADKKGQVYLSTTFSADSYFGQGSTSGFLKIQSRYLSS